MRMTVNGTGKSALLAITDSHSDYHPGWLGIDFSGNLHSWSSGCMTSNVWIAEVVKQEKNYAGVPGAPSFALFAKGGNCAKAVSPFRKRANGIQKRNEHAWTFQQLANRPTEEIRFCDVNSGR